MLIDSLAYALDRSGALTDFWGKLDTGDDAALAVPMSARPFMVAARFAAHPQSTLVVIAGEEAADTFARNVAAYVGPECVVRFPDRLDAPYNPRNVDVSQVAQRLAAADALDRNLPVVVVASARSLLRLLPPASAGVHYPLVLRAGLDLVDMPQPDGCVIEDFDALLRALEQRGYQNTGELDGPGTFSTTGGIVDIYPGNCAAPVQLDFFGDQLEEMRRIVPSTGQTITQLNDLSVYGVREFPCSPATISTLQRKLKRQAQSNPFLRELLEKMEGGLHFEGADALQPYLYETLAGLGVYAGKQTLTVLVEPRSLFDDAVHAYEQHREAARGSGILFDKLYAEPADISFGRGQRATYASIMRAGAHMDCELPVKRVDVAGDPDKLFGRLRQLIEADYTVVFSAPAFRVRQDMKLAFVEHGLAIEECLDVVDESSASHANIRKLKRGIINVVDVEVPLGMIIPKARLAMISVSDMQGTASRKSARAIDITEITFPYAPGDYVVHAMHGVAYFSGLEKQVVDGVSRDYLLLEYAEGDKLYVPVEQLDRVTRYVGPEGNDPRLTRLNTSDWSRALTRARKATKKLAFDLVDVYARRAAVQGFRFSGDTPWQKEMEDAFPYDETPDQLAAIADVKADMQSAKPMDRLICGDVGFGKTEVALRAAFKATQDNKQVMVLCPTTILAQQHYVNFSERCEPFGVNVEVLSRFRTPAQQKAALEGFTQGSVDILVGTHRLLSRDVNPHDLGLVIIDEEQRFGVGHKEQLKDLREHIDVLTLSATPIPRTMQMSLSGVRDMSLILSPPDERRPVEVFVGEWDPDVVNGAIRHELARGGQVYYVSNRVRTIEEAVQRVSEAAGEARIGVAHGQMDKDQLEHVMEDFAAGQLDVLVATTIIESGIDNPHTNTLIIEDSQRLGLAQMYQLKGRVGRSAIQAYAYFMFPDNIPLTEEALARLTAINEHQDLGSGMRIALRDLEIRGAGSMLGAEQHGNMSAVGFDLFAQMLATAVSAMREGNLKAADALPPAVSDITVSLPGSAYIPEDYVPAADERVLWYRRIASASSVALVDELEDRLREERREKSSSAEPPDYPSETRNLFAKARIKALCVQRHIGMVSLVGGKLIIEPVDLSRDAAAQLRKRTHAQYAPDKRKLRVPMRALEVEGDDSYFEAVFAFIEGL